MRLQERKQDTRLKIEHGGLVKKAGLNKLKTNELLGLLLDAHEKLSGNDGETYRAEWQLKGDIAFTKDEINKSDHTT